MKGHRNQTGHPWLTTPNPNLPPIVVPHHTRRQWKISGLSFRLLSEMLSAGISIVGCPPHTSAARPLSLYRRTCRLV